MRLQFLPAACIAVVILTATFLNNAQADIEPWSSVDNILHQINAPEFPNRDFNITEFGAIEGGKDDCSKSIAKAIAACHDSGGGRVIVPQGTFLTGGICLQSNVNLHLLEGTVLRFSTDPTAYLPLVHTRWEGTELMNYSALIYAVGQENIAITGSGLLDGAASYENWWEWARKAGKKGESKASPYVFKLVEMAQRGVPVAQRVFGEGCYLRPNFIQAYNCRNILIEDVSIHRSPMWEIHPVFCENITIRGVKIDSNGPNNDGCSPDSSKNVLIENCTFVTGDDCISIKSGRNNDGRRAAIATENVVIRNCAMKQGHAGVAIGSEISGNVRNIFIDKCKMSGTDFDRALRMKSNAVRGGTIENVHMRGVEIGRVNEAIVTIDLQYEEGADGQFPPSIRNISIDHCVSASSPRVLWVMGIPQCVIDNIAISDCTFSGVETAEVLSYAERIVFNRVTIKPAKLPRGLHSLKAALPETNTISPGNDR